MRRSAYQLLTCYSLLALTFVGCGAVEQARSAAKRQQMANFLKQIGVGYHNCDASLGRGPADWQELQKFDVPAEVQQILESEGYTIIFWNVKLTDVVGGASAFIGAYSADAATNGGTVLTLDGAVTQMTAQEFNDALAKQKAESPKAMAGAPAGGGAATPSPPGGAGPPGPPAAPGY